MALLYDRLQFIACGVQGKVLRCSRKVDNGIFAMKQVRLPGRLIRVDFLRNLKNVDREIRILKQVSGSSPYIVQLEDYWFTPDFTLACLIMEFLPLTLYRTIQKQQKTNSKFQDEQIWRWFAELVQGLHAIHTAGIIHRDLKPTNVLLTDDSRDCKIADFGVARSCVPDSQTSPDESNASISGYSWLDTDGVTLDVQQQGAYSPGPGAEFYSSPEMLRGEDYNQKTDIFSLGCVLYETATLQRAFKAEDGAYDFLLFGQAVSCLRSELHACDDSIVHLCDWMLKFNPNERPDTVALKSDSTLHQHVPAALLANDVS
eukprot:gnl/MRDRNA2_/MRDRNA2_322636_c0_seq1.p1 gnl/MRDRNA2_/MRDRNA2_322636_c0~~gnl/MRDRNA2_/MRDRNA2_322636_c0_seq1.p1  ORF type:complete len:353 (-),score=59.99 gnl/MRDRNA2_/MRDRNA2_322636_c0_seq1:4-951(-)